MKENPEGVSAIVEEMCNEAAEKRLLKDILNLMHSTQWSAEKAMDALRVPEIERRGIRKNFVQAAGEVVTPSKAK